MAFEIPSVVAPIWNIPHRQKTISDQVGDLCDHFASSGNIGAVTGLMRGLALVDRASVHDRYLDAREWKIASAALVRAFREAGNGQPTGNSIVGAMVDEIERARIDAAEEDDDFASEPLLKSISKTHQNDRFPATLWDEERCAAASVVGVTAMCGQKALRRLAQEVSSDLVELMGVMEAASQSIAQGDLEARQEGRRAILPLLTVIVDATRMQLNTMLERKGWRYVDSSYEGPAVFLSSDNRRQSFWLRDEHGHIHQVRPADPQEQASGVEVKSGTLPKNVACLAPPQGMDFGVANLQQIELPDRHVVVPMLVAQPVKGKNSHQSATVNVELDPSRAAVMMALCQATGNEQQLLTDAIDGIGAETDRIGSVLSWLGQSDPESPEVMQFLADALLYAERNAYSGLNLLPVCDLLQRVGIDAKIPAVALSLPELARMSHPGEAFLLAGKAHAVAYLHLADGRRLIYDSEGIFGVEGRMCIATYDPYGAPKRTEALDRHYGKFLGLLRVPLEQKG